MASLARRHGQLVEKLAGRGFDGDGGVSLLVWVNPDYDHSRSPFLRWPVTAECQRTGLSGGVKPRSYQVTLVLLERRRATDRMQVRPYRPTPSLGVSPPPASSLTGTSVTSRSLRTRMTLTRV